MYGSRMVATSSGIKTASAQIMNGAGCLMGIDVQSPASGITLLTIYDSADSDITNKLVLAEVEMDAGFMSLTHEYMAPVVANNGIYVIMTGPSLRYIVRYSLGG